MGTRANIAFVDRHDTFWLYRGSDGYPKSGEHGVTPDLDRVIRMIEQEGHGKHQNHYVEAAEVVAWFLIDNYDGFHDRPWVLIPQYRLAEDYQHDIEWLYVVDVEGMRYETVEIKLPWGDERYDQVDALVEKVLARARARGTRYDQIQANADGFIRQLEL